MPCRTRPGEDADLFCTSESGRWEPFGVGWWAPFTSASMVSVMFMESSCENVVGAKWCVRQPQGRRAHPIFGCVGKTSVGERSGSADGFKSAATDAALAETSGARRRRACRDRQGFGALHQGTCLRECVQRMVLRVVAKGAGAAFWAAVPAAQGSGRITLMSPPHSSAAPTCRSTATTPCRERWCPAAAPDGRYRVLRRLWLAFAAKMAAKPVAGAANMAIFTAHIAVIMACIWRTHSRL